MPARDDPSKAGAGAQQAGAGRPAASGDDVILRVEDLRKRYGGNEVVRGLTFAIRRGECFGLLGPNGAGKTTTLRCCLGLIEPDGGTIRMVGEPVPQAAREAQDERHLCPLQLDVIDRALIMWSNPGDVVLSPFMGIGSEGYVALEMSRRFVGVELKASYFKQAAANLALVQAKSADLFAE